MAGNDGRVDAMQKGIRTVMVGLALTMSGMALFGGSAIALHFAGLREGSFIAAGLAIVAVVAGVVIQMSGVRAYRAASRLGGGG